MNAQIVETLSTLVMQLLWTVPDMRKDKTQRLYVICSKNAFYQAKGACPIYWLSI